MTKIGSAESRPALAELTLPPWLWAWLVAGLALGLVPAQISRVPSSFVYFFGPESSSRYFDRGYVTTGRFFFVFALLIFAAIVAGAVASMLPHLRGRWVERRFKLASDDRPVVAEMQRFVDSYDPSIQLRISIRADQMARIYPVGWRGARIAVFRPLTVLWRRDRGAAEAILLHEVAHRRQGDQLIVGLGSPFVWLMRIWVPAYIMLALIPALIYVTAGGGGPLDTRFAGFQAGEYSVTIPVQILLPVTALWLAELNADRLTVQVTGFDAIQRALQATSGSRTRWTARALSFVSHPPHRLRLRSAEARSVGSVVLVGAWPAAMTAWALALLAVFSVILLPLASQLGLGPGLILKTDVQILLSVIRPLSIATAVLLLAWPALSVAWERLWSPAPRPARHQLWWPYLVAASVPVVLLVLSLIPLAPSWATAVPSGHKMEQEMAQVVAGCSQLAGWESGPGQHDYDIVAADLDPLIYAAGPHGTMASRRAAIATEDTAIAVALNSSPQFIRRSGLTQALTDYLVAMEYLQASNNNAFDQAVLYGLRQATAALSGISDLAQQCKLPPPHWDI